MTLEFLYTILTLPEESISSLLLLDTVLIVGNNVYKYFVIIWYKNKNGV